MMLGGIVTKPNKNNSIKMKKCSFATLTDVTGQRESSEQRDSEGSLLSCEKSNQIKSI